jgi:hypothetical protein
VYVSLCLCRWKITYASVVYITDESMTTEITSYVLPITIPRVLMGKDQASEHERIRLSLMSQPEACTSHTGNAPPHTLSHACVVCECSLRIAITLGLRVRGMHSSVV